MLSYTKLKQEIRPGKKLFCMNPFADASVRELTVLSSLCASGKYRYRDESSGFESSRYLTDDVRPLKFIGFTRAAAENARRNYINNPASRSIVQAHWDECSLWEDVMNYSLTDYCD